MTGARPIRRMEPITDHMRNVSLSHRAAEAAMASARTDESGGAVDGSGRPAMITQATESGAATTAAKSGSTGKDKVTDGVR